MGLIPWSDTAVEGPFQRQVPSWTVRWVTGQCHLPQHQSFRRLTILQHFVGRGPLPFPRSTDPVAVVATAVVLAVVVVVAAVVATGNYVVEG